MQQRWTPLLRFCSACATRDGELVQRQGNGRARCSNQYDWVVAFGEACPRRNQGRGPSIPNFVLTTSTTNVREGEGQEESNTDYVELLVSGNCSLQRSIGLLNPPFDPLLTATALWLSSLDYRRTHGTFSS